MTLVPALVIVLTFACQLVQADKVSFPVDIAMILMPDWRHDRYFFEVAFNKCAEHFEMGEDKAMMALIRAFVPTINGEAKWLVQPLTGDAQLLLKKMQAWKGETRVGHKRDYAGALRALSSDVFAHSGKRAKFVFIMIPGLVTGNQKGMNDMVSATKQLRDEGCDIYITITGLLQFFQPYIKNMTGDPGKMFKFPEHYYNAKVADLMVEVFKRMDADLASRPTIPTQWQTATATTQQWAHVGSTTSGGDVTEPVPPLQWAMRLVIGLTVMHFRYIS